jgi:hypothetical protein
MARLRLPVEIEQGVFSHRDLPAVLPIQCGWQPRRRPTIGTNAPASISYDGSFNVPTRMRYRVCCSYGHSILIPLTWISVTWACRLRPALESLTVSGPNSTSLLGGYYMLFLVNGGPLRLRDVTGFGCAAPIANVHSIPSGAYAAAPSCRAACNQSALPMRKEMLCLRLSSAAVDHRLRRPLGGKQSNVGSELSSAKLLR